MIEASRSYIADSARCWRHTYIVPLCSETLTPQTCLTVSQVGGPLTRYPGLVLLGMGPSYGLGVLPSSLIGGDHRFRIVLAHHHHSGEHAETARGP
jgi:hypothetical protein